MWDKVQSIELNIETFGSAKIIIRDENTHPIEVLKPQWDKRFDVFNNINNQFLEEIRRRSYGKYRLE
jgi:hypothetical protein